MKHLSSLLTASTLAILPISAFAQQTATPAKTAEPTTMTTAAPTTAAPSNTKTQAATKAPAAQTETHNMKTTTKTHHAKTGAPAKPVEPAKS